MSLLLLCQQVAELALVNAGGVSSRCFLPRCVVCLHTLPNSNAHRSLQRAHRVSHADLPAKSALSTCAGRPVHPVMQVCRGPDSRVPASPLGVPISGPGGGHGVQHWQVSHADVAARWLKCMTADGEPVMLTYVMVKSTLHFALLERSCLRYATASSSPDESSLLKRSAAAARSL